MSKPNVLERRTMEIEVYDTYATSDKGIKIHFDVMLPIGGNEEQATSYAQDFIKTIAESTDSVKLDSCKFCHTEEAKADVSEKVEKDRYVLYRSKIVRINTRDVNHRLNMKTLFNSFSLV